MSNELLPDGWISEYDPQNGRPYYVDTRQQNPTAQWEHPGQMGGEGQRGLMSNVMSSFGGKTQQQQTSYNPPSQQCKLFSTSASQRAREALALLSHTLKLAVRHRTA